MTDAQLRQWLRDWVARTTGTDVAAVLDDRPLESYGLASRDVVSLSGELEDLLGATLDATVAYEYPTIATLAKRLLNGPSHAPKQAQAAEFSAPARGAGVADPDIAVVGMSARFPGGALDLDSMWDLLIAGRDGIIPPPPGRWSEFAGDDVTQAKLQNIQLKAGFLTDLKGFDAEFFGLSPREAESVDPQQRLALELSWEALEQAHIPADSLRGRRVGVYMGTTANDYGMLITADPAEMHPYAMTGTASSIIANRVSYVFDFRGPSVAVDTACSSSLVAIHDAVTALRLGHADIALAGGVNVMATPSITAGFGELGVLSAEGKIKAFSADADGFIRGEGGGVVVLKPLQQARRDGDTIYGVIKGSAVNNDGRSNGLTAPNPDAQVDVLRRAYADAGVDPATVDYVEAHGTGTILGDPIEASALGVVLGRGRESADPLLLGSAKTNFGHTEAAAGVAGLIKVLLGFSHDLLPASLNFTAPNPYIDFDADHLEVVTDAREWPEYAGVATAGVSGFGFGGTNAHVVVQAPEAADRAITPTLEADLPLPGAVILPVSAFLPSRRREAAAALADYLEGAGAQVPLTEIARTLSKRNGSRSRAAVVADDHATAIKGLRAVAEGKRAAGVYVADSPTNSGVVWVFSGFGSQHRKMATQLYALSPVFARELDALDALISAESGWSLVELITDDAQTYNLETAQVGITAIQIALVELLREFGVKPAAVVGHSMGEIAAAYAAGGLSKQDAMLIACARSRLMGEGEASLSEEEAGGMALVELDADELPSLIAQYPEFQGLEAAVIAAPGYTTVGGPQAAVEAVVAYCENNDKMGRVLPVRGAGHTSAVDPMLGDLLGEIAGIEPQPISVPLYSSVDDRRLYGVGELVHDADYFIRCTRQMVQFANAVSTAAEDGHTAFLEVAPHPVAMMSVAATLFAQGNMDPELGYLLKRKEDARETLTTAFAQLWANGHPIDLAPLYGHGRYAAVPATGWRKQKVWTNARPGVGANTRRLPGARVHLPDGRSAFAVGAEVVPSLTELVETTANAVIGPVTIRAIEDPLPLPVAGPLTAIVAPHPGGCVVSVFAVEGEDMRFIAEAVASSTNAPEPVVPGDPAVAAAVEATYGDSDAPPVGLRWNPESEETVTDRLVAIVAESMGYQVEDLPLELALTDLGLDSLMAMRIKNRIEYDFDLPELQVQALRDASVGDVIELVEQQVAARRSGGDAATAPATAETTPTADSAAPEQPVKPGMDVAPRDASERLVFAAWAQVTGSSAGGVTTALPRLADDQAAEFLARLIERSGGDVDAEAVREAQTLEDIATLVRPNLEVEVEGNIRPLRTGEELAGAPLFLFHPAGGTSAVYAPLVRRLAADRPVYGIERLEGPIEERAAAYVDDITRLADGKPVILGGWSFGGALAAAVAELLADHGVEVALLVMLDTVQPSEQVPNTPEETRARWQRYSSFAKKTYGLDFEIPDEFLDAAGEDGMLDMLGEYLATTDASEHGLSSAVLEHQRASFVDNRMIEKLDFQQWRGLKVPMVLFRAERMHDGAVELEPRYAHINHDGGWSEVIEDLDIVQLRGDHLAIVDEPEIGKVATYLSAKLEQLGI